MSSNFTFTNNNTQYDFSDIFVKKQYFLTFGLVSWGENGAGNVGDGTVVIKSSPVTVPSANVDWSQISSSGHTLAVKANGALWAWGSNNYGELGNGSAGTNGGAQANTSIPAQVGVVTNWKTVSAQNGYSLGIRTDGTLWAWGYNAEGSLGDGTVTHRSSPVQIGSLTTWATLGTSSQQSPVFAIKTDGTLWGWGFNSAGGAAGSGGALGDGTITSKSSPVQIGNLTNWKQISCGYHQTAAIKTDGTMWAWGYNSSGQLGIGNTTSVSSPVQVGTSTNWKQVACTGSSTVGAVKTDGTLWTWGLAGDGALGNGTNSGALSSPIQVGSLTNWKSIYAGDHNFLAQRTDGSVWSWGKNLQSELGIGTNGVGTYKSSPVQVGSLTNWTYVTASNHGGLMILGLD
jgi:alpha-tubulin suppressor-like RCC1 family protein